MLLLLQAIKKLLQIMMQLRLLVSSGKTVKTILVSLTQKVSPVRDVIVQIMVI